MKDLSKCKYVAIDFDGTIIADGEFPQAKKLMPYADVVINELYASGRVITIWTCREDEKLETAKLFLKNNGIQYHYINENTPELKELWGNDCRKIGSDVYIDDKSHSTETIDWLAIRKQFFGGV